MARLLLESTAARLPAALDAIEAMTTPKNKSPRRRVRTPSKGGGSRSWVKITSVEDPANYTGSVYTAPTGSLIKSGVTIKVFGATSNEFQVGYASFADLVTEEGAEVYYIDGAVLG